MLQSPNFASMFRETVHHDPLKIFEKGSWLGSRDP